MIPWMAELGDTVALKAVPDAWPDGGLASAQPALRLCPVGAREILSLAQTLPLEIWPHDAGFHVMAVLDPERSQVTPFGPEGRWRLPTKPAALRHLPFIVDVEGQLSRIAPRPDEEEVSRDAALQVRMGHLLRETAADYKALDTLARQALDRGWLTHPEAPMGDTSEGDEKPGLAETGRVMGPLEKGPDLAASYRAQKITDAEMNLYRLLAILAFSQKNARQPALLRTHFAYGTTKTRAAETDDVFQENFLSFDTNIDFG